MIASSCSRSICNPYFDDFWEAMTWIMSKSLALLQWVVCHERSVGPYTVREMKEGPSGSAIMGFVSRVTPVQTALRNCLEMKAGPSGSAIRSLIQNHRKLLRSKAVVVSVAEKSGQDPGRYGRERRAQANRRRTVGCPTSRDFVPWRFLDASCCCAWIASSCRRPRNLDNCRLMHRTK